MVTSCCYTHTYIIMAVRCGMCLAPREFSTVSLLQIKPHAESIIWRRKKTVLCHVNPFVTFANEYIRAILLRFIFLCYLWYDLFRGFDSLMKIHKKNIVFWWIKNEANILHAARYNGIPNPSSNFLTLCLGKIFYRIIRLLLFDFDLLKQSHRALIPIGFCFYVRTRMYVFSVRRRWDEKKNAKHDFDMLKRYIGPHLW